MSNTKTWTEAGQTFTREGLCIRTLKPGRLKLAYGDERLRALRAAQATAGARPRRFRRVISFLRLAPAA